jgi:hypothetical protein
MTKKLTLLCCVFALFAVTSNAQGADDKQEVTPPPPTEHSTNAGWEISVAKIEQAKSEGKITIDEAALLRLQALIDPSALPEEFRPDVRELADAQIAGATTIEMETDGLAELARIFDVIYTDKDSWSASTRSAIEAQIFTPPVDATLAPPDVYQTLHFNIRWNSNPASQDYPPGGLTYIQDLGNGLEDAWSDLEDPLQFGFQMPDAGDYYVLTPEGPIFLDKFEVEVVNEIRPCNQPFLEIDTYGVTLPGYIWINKNRVAPSIEGYKVGHETFHLVHWNYAGFRNVGCFEQIQAFLSFYSGSGTNERGAWLMESSSVWLEDELYNVGYSGWVDLFNEFPDVSLFSRPPDDDPADSREYAGVLFLKFLQEKRAGGNRNIVLDIWENVGQGNAPVSAVTNALLELPAPPGPYTDYAMLWQDTYAYFAVTDYKKDLLDAMAWPAGSEVKPKQQLNPVAGIPINVSEAAFDDPGFQAIEILTTNLNLPAGTDQTGATLTVDLSTDCPYCALDVLQFDGAVITDLPRIYFTGNGSHTTNQSFPNFGVAGGLSKVTLIFSNGAGGYGDWGYDLPTGIAPFSYYKLHYHGY